MTDTDVITLTNCQYLTLDQSYELSWHNNGRSLAVLGSHQSVDDQKLLCIPILGRSMTHLEYLG